MMKRHGKSKPIFGTDFHIESCFSLHDFCMFRTFYVFVFNCFFCAFYKENHSLEVPRETRLEKLMRLLDVSSKMHGGKAELSTKTILSMQFWSKSHMAKNQASCSRGWI